MLDSLNDSTIEYNKKHIKLTYIPTTSSLHKDTHFRLSRSIYASEFSGERLALRETSKSNCQYLAIPASFSAVS